MNTTLPNDDGRAGGIALLDPPTSDRRSDESPVAGPIGGRGGPPRRLLVAVLLLAAAGGAAWWLSGSVALEAIRSRLPWQSGDEAEALVLFGNVDVRQVALGFKVDGRIARLDVDEGDAVEAGEVMATLDRRYFEDELRLARARRDMKEAALDRLENGSRPEEIAQARAVVAQRLAEASEAAIERDRTARLRSRDVTTPQDLDRADAASRVAQAQLESAREALRLAELGPREEDIEAARADLEAAEAEVVRAERRLDDATLVSPNRGVVLTRAREAGAIVQPGETVFSMTLETPVWVRTYVDEPGLGLVRPGAAADVITDGRPDRPYRGHVGFVSPTAEFTPKSVETPELRTRLVYRVRAVVDDPDGGLRQGMPVTVRVPLPAEEPRP